MGQLYDAIVIGGGVAGCTAAIDLARRGREVLLLEKNRLARDKLCGEFLSPESRRAFADLGLTGTLSKVGSHLINNLRATGLRGARYDASLPSSGIGLSRLRLDQLLADAATEAGARLVEQARVRAIHGSLEKGYRVEVDGTSFRGRVVLGAHGKRATIDRKLHRRFIEEQPGIVAFKAHYRGEVPDHRIELHGFRGGYCGVQRVEAGKVNVCWLSTTDALQEAGGAPGPMLRRAASQNDFLQQRMSRLTRVSDQFLAVSQLYLHAKSPFAGDVCMIGDAAGMISPMCGDGMAMAMAGARIATPLADEFLAGERSAISFKHAFASAWRERFGWRMRLGRWMHRLYLQPLAAHAVLRLCRRMPSVGNWLIRQTRG